MMEGSELFILMVLLRGFLFAFLCVLDAVCILLLLGRTSFLLLFLSFDGLLGFLEIVLIFVRGFGRILGEGEIGLNKVLGLLQEAR